MKTVFALYLLLTATAATAEAVQPLASIEAAVRDYLGAEMQASANTEYSVGRLDPRLRLPLCDSPLATRFTHGRTSGGPSSVEVRCEGAKPWSLYVGVIIEQFADVVVTTRPLPRDSVIGESDVTLVRRRIDGARADYLGDIAHAVGQVTARAVGADQMLGASKLKRQHLIRRGDEVILAAAGGTISVRMKGKALENGAPGERISVRNHSSERVVEGVVNAQGMVVVTTGALL